MNGSGTHKRSLTDETQPDLAHDYNPNQKARLWAWMNASVLPYDGICALPLTTGICLVVAAFVTQAHVMI